MAELPLVEAINDAFHVELERDANVMVHRRGRRPRRRRLPRDRRAARPLRRRPLRRHAARRGGHPRQRGRALHGGLAAGLRDAVRRLLVPVPRPADHARRPLPLADRRGDGVPARRAHALRRRRARARAARRLAGGLLRAHAGGEGRDPVDAGATRRACSPRRSAIPDPVVILEPKLHYRTMRGEVPEGEHVVPLGKARLAREGDRRDARRLRRDGAALPSRRPTRSTARRRVEVLDIRTLKPLDEDALLASAAKTGRVVIVQEAPRTARLRAPSWRRSSPRRRCSTCRARSLRVTGYDVPYPYWQIEDAYMPSVERVVDAARKLLEF